MFPDIVTTTELTTDLAAQVFPNINEEANPLGDVSLLSVLRVFLPSRLPEGVGVLIRHGTIVRPSSNYEALAEGAGGNDATNVLRIVNLIGGKEETHGFLNGLTKEEVLKEHFPGYVEDVALSNFAAQNKIGAKFLLNSEKKTTLVIISNMGARLFHFICCVCPRFFPWYFNDAPEHKLTDEEKAVCNLMLKTNSDDFTNWINNYAKRFDFRSVRIRNILKGFETKADRAMMERLKTEKNEYMEKISRHTNAIADCYQSINVADLQINSLLEKISSGESSDGEFMQYVLRNEHVDIVACNDMTLRLVISTTLSNFDPDIFNRYFGTRSSVLFENPDTGRDYDGMSHENWKLFLKAAFEDEVIRIRSVAAYEVNFERGTVRGLQGYSFGDKYKTYLPNFHIQNYSCLGGNEAMIAACASKRDFVGVLEGCCASAANINFADQTVFRRFAKALCAENCARVVELPNGGLATPREAVAWLKEQEGKSE